MKLKQTLIFILTFSLTPLTGMAKPEVYSEIPLLGTEETPPNTSLGYGALTAIYDDDLDRLSYEFEWKLEGANEATAVHFHGPAARGESAPPVFDLGPISGNSGKLTGVVTLDADQEADLKAGLWYLNIHSTAFPAGEIRGQLVEMSPLDSTAVFDPTEGRLHLESVMVPGVGVFEAELDIISGTPMLLFELDEAHPKQPDDDEEEDEDGEAEDRSGDDGLSIGY